MSASVNTSSLLLIPIAATGEQIVVLPRSHGISADDYEKEYGI